MANGDPLARLREMAGIEDPRHAGEDDPESPYYLGHHFRGPKRWLVDRLESGYEAIGGLFSDDDEQDRERSLDPLREPVGGQERPAQSLDRLREMAGVGTGVASPPPAVGVEPAPAVSTAVAPPTRGLAGPPDEALEMMRDEPSSERARLARQHTRFREGYVRPAGPIIRREPERLTAALGTPLVEPEATLLEDRPTPEPGAPLEPGAFAPPETRVPDPERPGEFYAQEVPTALRRDLSDKERAQAYDAPTTRLDRLQSDLTGIARGAFNLGALLPQAVAELDAILARRMGPLGVGSEDATEHDLYELSQSLRAWSDEHLAGDPRLQDAFRTKLAEGFGSAVPFLAASVATGGMAAPMGLGVLTGVGSAAGRAREMGGDVERAALLGGVVGSTEALPFARLFGRLRRAVPPGQLNRLRQAATAAGGQALEEGVQEAAAEVAYNYIAQLDDEDQELFENFVDSFGIGAAVGALLGGGAGLVGRTIQAPDPDTGELRSFKVTQAAFRVRGEDIPSGEAHDIDAALEGRPEGERRAIMDALADPNDPSVLRGFVDSEGRFLDAETAMRLAGAERPESSFIAQTEAGGPLRGQGAPRSAIQRVDIEGSPIGDPIVGEVGQLHGDLAERSGIASIDLLGPGQKAVSGFADERGSFLTREEAAQSFPGFTGGRPFGAEDVREGLRGPQGRRQAADTVTPGVPVAGPTGAESVVKAAGGAQAPVRYRVVEADRLTTSHNPETFQQNPRFPEGVQERRYHDDPVAQERVVETAQNLDPDLVLDPTPSAVSGPPIVLPDGIVLSGNQRSMAISRAYRGVPARAEAYRRAVAERAEQFGIDPAQVEGMERPVLVREFDAPHMDRAALAELSARFNEPPTKARDPLADAAVRARRLREATPTLEHFAATIEPDQTVRQYVGTAAGREFVNRLVQTGIITKQEAGRYLDKTGALNIQGKFLVERMLQLAAVGDPEVVARTPAFALRKIERAAPAIVRASTVEGWDLAPTLRESLDLLAAVRAQPDASTVAEYVAQVDAFGREFSEPAARLARVLESESVVEVTRRFRAYAADAEAYARQVETRDVFGHEPPGPAGSFAERFELEAERPGRLRGPQGAVAMPMGQGEIFGRPSPAEGGRQFGFGLEGPRRPEGVTQAERRARAIVDRLRPLIERGAVTPDQREEYRQAVAFLRRNESLSEEEARLLADPQARPDTESGTLALMPDRASQPAPESLTPPPESGKPVSAPEVIDQLANVVKAAGGKAPIRTGRTPLGARGVFKVGPEVIRVREANDIHAAVHEVAHALEKQIIGNPADGPWKHKMAAAALQEELESLGRELYGDTTPSNGYLSEGWAEYLRLWVTDSEAARSKAPRFTKWFEGQFSDELPDVRNALDDAQDTARRWARQGSVLRAAAQTVDPADPRARLKRAGRALTGGLYEKWVEAFQPLYKMAREAEARLERKLEPEEDPYTVASALRYRHSARVRYMVETAMLDIAGNRVGPALEDVRGLVAEAPIPKRYDGKLSRHQLFGIYLWARRAEALYEDPKGARNPGLSKADARQVIEELDSDQFQRAAGIVHSWNRGVLEYAAGKDTSDPEAGVQWRVPAFKAIMDKVLARDPGDYIPLKREMDELDSVWRSASRTASTRSPVARLVGSGRRIKDPLQSMIAQAEQMVRAAHERMVVDQIVKLSEVDGLGHLVEEVPPDQAPVAARTVDELVRELERRGALEEGTRESLGDEAGDLVTFFAPKRHPDTKEPIIPVHEDGRVRWLRVNTELFEALEGMDIYRAGPVVDWLLVKPASLFRAGTTGIRASFGLVTNPLRDWQSFIVNTRSKRGPLSPRLWWDLTRSMGEAIGARTVGRRSEWADAFIRLGGEMTQPLGEDIPQTRRAARRLTRSQSKLARSDLAKKLGVSKILDLHSPADFYDAFRDLVQAPEAGPRIAEIKQVAEEVGWEPGQKMSLNQALQLSLAAGQVTTDFAAAGHLGRAVNRAVPFFNAAIQGPRANLRALRRNPVRTTLAVGVLALAGIANWYRNKDEPWYKELDYRDRYRYWWVPVETPSGETTLLRIPRAFEIGAVAALPEAVLEQWYEEDPEAVEAWIRSTAEVSLPPGVEWPYPLVTGPVLGRLVVEQAANRRFFFDSPLVPRGEEGMPAEEQYGPYTTEASRVLGDLFNVSPRRLDHIRESILGRVSTDILDVLQIGRQPPAREGEAADLPVAGVLFKRGGRYSYPKSVEDVYDELGQAQKRQRSGRLSESPRQRQLRLQLQDAANAISALSYVASHTEERDKRHRINEMVSEIAREALAEYRAGRVQRGRFRALRKRAEAQEKRIGRLEGPGTPDPLERLRAMAGVR